MTDMRRARAMFNYWYQPHIRMDTEDWIYIAVMIWVSITSFGLGLLIGSLWARFI